MNHLLRSVGICALVAMLATGCASETERTIDDLESLTEDAGAAMATMSREEAKTSATFKALAVRSRDLEARMKKQGPEFTPEQLDRISKIIAEDRKNSANWK